MFGKLGDMTTIMKKVLEMKTEMGRIKKEISEAEVKGVCENLVEVTLAGDMTVKQIKIAPELITEGDTQKVENMVTIAVTNAIEDAKSLSKRKLSSVTGGLNIPGLEGLFG